jgi:hypothetical protein
MAVTINEALGSVYANYSNVKETFPVSTPSSTDLEGEVLTVDTLVAGTGYTTITSAPISGGTGTGLVVNITAAAGLVTAVTVVDGGTGYLVNDTITLTGGNADATFDVATISSNVVAVSNVRVSGTYSKFLTEAQVGDYIWLKDNDELKRIENILSDNEITLGDAATTDASTDYAIVKRECYHTVSWLVDDADAAEINGVSMLKNSSDSFCTRKRFIPILIDSTINGNVVTLSAKG